MLVIVPLVSALKETLPVRPALPKSTFLLKRSNLPSRRKARPLTFCETLSEWFCVASTNDFVQSAERPRCSGLTTEPVPVFSRIRPLPDGKVITPLVCSIRCVDRHFQRHCRTNRSLRPLVPWSSSLFPSRSAKSV